MAVAFLQSLLLAPFTRSVCSSLWQAVLVAGTTSTPVITALFEQVHVVVAD
jgi:hypothetical protein